MDNLFLLHCVVSANVRQSASINFDDLKLPGTVVATLRKRRAFSIRPRLSLKLVESLSQLRLQQRYLYLDCCIHKGDIHFLHGAYFEEALSRIETIRRMAKEYNEELYNCWEEEYENWHTCVDKVLEPIFEQDLEGFEIAREAYLRMFPPKEKFKNAIEVFVVGPIPACFDEVTQASDHPLSQESAVAASLNTREVYESAIGSAADRAMFKASELLDDIEARAFTNISHKQTGSDKKRGNWELIANELLLISTYCPDFKDLASLATDLHAVSKELNDDSIPNKQKSQTVKKYEHIKRELRDEMKRIVDSRDSSEGYEALKKSLALSNSYKDLIAQIQNAQTPEQLQELQHEIETETQVFEHRARQLQKMYKKQSELITAASVSLDDIIQEVKSKNVQTLDDVDF